MKKEKSPFTYINSIGFHKDSDMIYDEEFDKLYSIFLTNRFFSYHLDTLFMANQMNRIPSFSYNKTDNTQIQKAHYLAMLNLVRKRKRFGGWYKDSIERKNKIDVICEYYDMSNEKAKYVLDILSDDEIQNIKEWMETRKGGQQ